MPADICAAELLGLITQGTPKRVSSNTQLDSWSEEEKPSVKKWDRTYFPYEHYERLQQLWSNFDDRRRGVLGKVNKSSHRLNPKLRAQPVTQPSYCTGPRAKEFVREEENHMLKFRIIEPAISERASPVIFLPKQDKSYPMCIDYRNLSIVRVRDTYPLPRMDTIIVYLGDVTVFSTLDANLGYWQMPVAGEGKDKTTFTIHAALYRFNGMPFELINAPATF